MGQIKEGTLNILDCWWNGGGMWRSIPPVLLLSNLCLPQFSFLPFQLSTFAPAMLENDGQIISVGLEFGLPYDITSVLENSMGQTVTSISLLGGNLCKLTSLCLLKWKQNNLNQILQWLLCFWSACYFKLKCLSSSQKRGSSFNLVQWGT